MTTIEDELGAFWPCFRRLVLDLDRWGGSKTTSIRSRHKRRMQVNFIQVLLAMDEHCLMLGWVLHAGVNSSFYAGGTVVVKTSTC